MPPHMSFDEVGRPLSPHMSFDDVRGTSGFAWSPGAGGHVAWIPSLVHVLSLDLMFFTKYSQPGSRPWTFYVSLSSPSPQIVGLIWAPQGWNLEMLKKFQGWNVEKLTKLKSWNLEPGDVEILTIVIQIVATLSQHFNLFKFSRFQPWEIPLTMHRHLQHWLLYSKGFF